ncbi:MAG TPA: hypothetical protein VIS74_02965 [Chthoniobacterales bacterium]
MPAANPNQEGRAKLNFELEEDDPEVSKETVERKIQEISKKSGFTARASTGAPGEKPLPVLKKAAAIEERPRRRRAKTGRTYPFTTKIKPETYAKICTMADEATDREGRPVSLAEIIERALESLAEQK